MTKNGIRCPSCCCNHCPVVNTYQREVNFHGKTKTIIRRRRECRHCLRTFFTTEDYEPDEDAPPMGRPRTRSKPNADEGQQDPNLSSRKDEGQEPEDPPVNPFL